MLEVSGLKRSNLALSPATPLIAHSMVPLKIWLPRMAPAGTGSRAGKVLSTFAAAVPTALFATSW